MEYEYIKTVQKSQRERESPTDFDLYKYTRGDSSSQSGVRRFFVGAPPHRHIHKTHT